MKISVVTVCYNSVDTIEETMLSVLNQTYPDVEYIIIDGGSTDGSVDIIKKYADRLSYWVSEPDKGIYDAMNKGIAVATGDYINFMNSGDRFYNERVIDSIFSITKYDNEGIIYGDAVYQYHNHFVYRKPLDIAELPKHNCLFHQSMFTKTSLLKKTPYDISFKIAGDYNFSLLQYKNGIQFCYVPIPFAFFEGASGVSSNLIAIKMDEDLRVRGVNKTFLYLIKKMALILKSDIRKFLANHFPAFTEYIRIKLFVKKD